MHIIKLLIITFILLLIVVLALSVRLLFKGKGEFRGGSCKHHPDSLNKEGISCGCKNHNPC